MVSKTLNVFGPKTPIYISFWGMSICAIGFILIQVLK